MKLLVLRREASTGGFTTLLERGLKLLQRIKDSDVRLGEWQYV